MRSVTTWGDILALNWWAAVRSKPGWFVSTIVAASIAADIISRVGQEGWSARKEAVLFFVMFAALMAGIWMIGLVISLLIATAQLARRGTVGPKRFTIADEAFMEDDGHRVTKVPWRQIRSIDKTRRHIFVRISRWKYMQLSARDFQNEYQFAQYYADLVKAKHGGT